MNKKPKVLILSTGNSTRSQMAEGFFHRFGGDRFEVMSAGLDRGSLNPFAVEAMKESEIDISGQRPKSVTDSLKEHFGYVITVCDAARERSPIFPFTPHLIHWSIEDPTLIEGSGETRKEAFRRVRDDIREKVHTFLAETGEKTRTTAEAARA